MVRLLYFYSVLALFSIGFLSGKKPKRSSCLFSVSTDLKRAVMRRNASKASLFFSKQHQQFRRTQPTRSGSRTSSPIQDLRTKCPFSVRTEGRRLHGLLTTLWQAPPSHLFRRVKTKNTEIPQCLRIISSH